MRGLLTGRQWLEAGLYVLVCVPILWWIAVMVMA